MRKLTIFFRFDDFSEASPPAVEEGLVAALRKNGVCATFAVIPSVTKGSYHTPEERETDSLGPEKSRFLWQAVNDGVVDVALHGWNHRSRSHSSPHSEFVGLSTEEQLARIQKGRDLLRQAIDIHARVFVPPWNSYDGHTLEALVQAGIACISANRYGPRRNGSLQFAPITADMREMRAAIAAARSSRDPDPIIGILLHPYDFEESGDPRSGFSCSIFETELQWLRQQLDVRIVSVSALATENDTLRAARYGANQPLPYETIFPPFVRMTSATPFFRTEGAAKRAKAWRTLATVSTYLVAAVVGGLVAQIFWNALEMQAASLIGLSKGAVGSALAALLVRAAVRRKLFFRTMFVVALLSGMIIAAVY